MKSRRGSCVGRNFWRCAGAGLALLLIAVVVTFLARKHEPIRERDSAALVLREGRLFQVGENVPFTGIMVEQYPDGSRKSRSTIANGVLHGISEGWHTNGVMQVREHFREGISHGMRTKWHENGNKLSEASIVDGKLHGTFRRWHENGVLAEEVALIGGEPEGRSYAYYPSGFLKAQATVNAGEVIEQKYWDDGELKPPAGDGKDR